MSVQLWWIPPHVNSPSSDFRLLTRPWKNLIHAARSHPSWITRQRTKADLCQHCCQNYATDLHHLIPLWVFSLEAVIGQIVQLSLDIPQQEFALRCFVNLRREQERLFPQWHYPANLVSLCRSCHERAESKAYHFYKEQLPKKYAPLLHWNMESAEKAFTKINQKGGYLAN